MDVIYYGGSFNPPHIAHLLFVMALRAYYPDSEILVAPTYCHAFHKELMSYDFRLEMLHAMFDGISGIQISTIERDLHESTSYTIDVVRELKKRNPDSVIWVAVGSDIVPTLPEWRDYEDLCRLCKFLILPREGYDNRMAIEMPHLPEISSSEIREAISRKDVSYLRRYVPLRVLNLLKI